MPARSPRSSGRRAPTRAAARSSSSSTRRTRAWPRPRWSGSRPTSVERHALIAVAIHHRVGVVGIGETSVVIAVSSRPPRERARRLRRGDRHAQGHGAAVEEGDLRRRRGMDRAGLVSEPGLAEHGAPGAEQPPGAAPRRGCGRILAPLLVVGGVLLKVAGSLKFLGIFLAVGGYALIWGWRFGARVRPPHPRARARALRRGAAAGAEPAAARLHPVPRRVRRAPQPAVRSVAERARLGGRARSRAGSARSPASSTATRSTRTCCARSPTPASSSTSST